MIRYRVMANHQGQTEEIDLTSDKEEAIRWRDEYQIGSRWVVWVEVQTFVDGVLDECYPLGSK